MSTIIYIHGRGSNGNSEKAKMIREHFESEEVTVVTPTLNKNPILAIPQLWNVINEAKGSDTLLVGSSLGGLYADYFNAMADVPAILINPLTDLKLAESFFDDSEYKFIKSKHNDAHYCKNKSAPEFVFLAEDDEVIPFRESLHILEGNKMRKIYCTKKGGHRYSNHESIKYGIEEMLSIIEGVDFTELVPVFDRFAEKQRLAEKFVTAIPDDMELKEKLFPVIAPQINAAYAGIGGFVGVPDIRTSEQVKDKLMNNTIWKMVRRNNEIVAGIIYTLKQGRKGVVLWTNGTPEGKAGLKTIIREDEKMKRAWMEVSGPAEKFFNRNLNGSPLPREEAEVILDVMGKKVLKWHDDGFHYDREIQGQVHTKAIWGTVN